MDAPTENEGDWESTAEGGGFRDDNLRGGSSSLTRFPSTNIQSNTSFVFPNISPIGTLANPSFAMPSFNFNPMQMTLEQRGALFQFMHAMSNTDASPRFADRNIDYSGLNIRERSTPRTLPGVPLV